MSLNNNLNVAVMHGFLSEDEVLMLAHLPAAPAQGRFDAKLLHLAQDDADVRMIGADIRARIARILETEYETEKLFCDYLSYHVIGPGKATDHHPLHADCVNLDGSPNHTPRRIASALVYLSTAGEDFYGGSLHFENLDNPFTISPTRGTLVAFRGDLPHAHRVDPVTLGERRALAMWFSEDPNDEEPGW